MTNDIGRICVTGANGQLGQALLRRLAATPGADPVAIVRSKRAAEAIRNLEIDPEPEIFVVDYASDEAMTTALAGARYVVHLVGIIKEMAGASYVQAHETTCQVLARAASSQNAERIVYLSIFGSRADSTNACLASKGRAERILLGGDVPTTVLQVPMVLAGSDPASHSLRAQARARVLPIFGSGGALQQPIDGRDLVEAILAALQTEPGKDLALELGGPECLPHRALVLRAATLWGTRPKMIPIPEFLLRALFGFLGTMLRNPPMTRAMFDILQQDDRIDIGPACEVLGLTLTPLDETLADHVGPPIVESTQPSP